MEAQNIDSNRFTIDFFEFSFLLEACIPPTAIARSCFWDRAIDVYYYVLTQQERDDLLEWIKKDPHFKPDKEERCAIFEARYDKFNQYKVTTKFDGKIEEYFCFKWKDRYHTRINTSLQEQYITNIEKLFEK